LTCRISHGRSELNEFQACRPAQHGAEVA
jgi:hypothetical protein